jgi:hypothetical protein
VIGHSIVCAFDTLAPMTIVGVAGDVRQSGPADESRPECYMPYLQHSYNGATLSLVIRTTTDPMGLVETVRRKAEELAPGVPLRFTTLDALNRALPASSTNRRVAEQGKWHSRREVRKLSVTVPRRLPKEAARFRTATKARCSA